MDLLTFAFAVPAVGIAATGLATRRRGPMNTMKFRKCPICRTRSVIVQMPDDWQAQVDAGAAIPIVGCGNPWHYRFSEAEARAPQEAELARLRKIEAAARDFLADWDGFDDVRPSRAGDALRAIIAGEER